MRARATAGTMRPARPLAAALLLLAACGASDPLPFPAASPTASPDPLAAGPFPVGVRTVVWEDLDRPKKDHTPRRLVTEVWYPATQESRGLPGADYDVRSVLTAEQLAALGDAALPLLHTSAVRDAPPARSHGPFPLVIFSHGQGGVRWQSTYYTVPLASHGYVVVSPDHEGGTLCEAVRNTMTDVGTGAFARTADVSFLLDMVAGLPAGDPLAGLSDLSRVGVTGHSFGALTSLRSAAVDHRIRAIVPQAPPSADLSWLGLAKPVVLGIPVMIQAAHDDRTLRWDDHVAPTWPLLQRPRWLVDVTHGGHFTFSDLCALDLQRLAEQIHLEIPGADVSNVLDDGCGPQATPAAQAWPVIDGTAIAFFNAFLRGDAKTGAALTQALADRASPGVSTVTADP